MAGLFRAVIVLSVLAVLSAMFCFFTVSETEHAIRFRFSRIIDANYEPGLHFKYPWETVLKLDKRILTLDDKPGEFMTDQREKVFVDFFVKWKIVDPKIYYESTSGRESVVTKRLLDTVADGLMDEFAKRQLVQLVSVERSEVMQSMTAEADQAAEKYGVDILDVRIKRIDLSKTVSDAVYQRMKKEREREANERRAEGREEAERIQSVADKDRTVILANAYREAQEIRGAGDADAAQIYATAYQQNPEFYAFHRSMQAYRKSLGSSKDVMLIKPDSEFFKYFGQSSVKK